MTGINHDALYVSPNLLAAIDLARAGFAVFPIYPRGLDEEGKEKWTPNTGWQESASPDLSVVTAWWIEAPDAFVGLLTGIRNDITVLDIDTKNGKDGIATLFDLGVHDTKAMSPVRVQTPSGGSHYYFNFDARLKNWISKLGPGIDIKTEGGYVIAPGSYKNGKRYIPEGELLGTCLLPAFPQALVPYPDLELIEADLPIAEATPSLCAWAAQHLETLADELAATTKGSRNGKLNNIAMWAGGAGAHGFLSRDSAWIVLEAAAISAGLGNAETRATFKSGWEAGLRKPIKTFPQPDPTIERVNARHAVVFVNGKTLIASKLADGGFDFGRESDLHAFYANDRISKAKPKDSTEPVSSYWMRHPDRRTYDGGVEFAPGGAPPNVLNLWGGWAVQPNSAASCDLFLAHVLDIVCDGNADYAAYVLGWMAHMIQRPQEKPGVALVLRGPKGAGKDTVGEYLACMIGQRHVPTVMNANQFAGRFNAIVESALLLHVQEGFWAGDKGVESTLKGLVSSHIVAIERKGVDTINMPSVLRLFISANAEWVVPASEDERRWAVFKVSGARAQDQAYFKALRAEMEGEGPAALLHYFQTFDLSNFDVRAAPETEGLRDQKLASLRSIHRWWFEALQAGHIGSYSTDHNEEWEAELLTVECEALRNVYASFMRGRKYDGEAVGLKEFGKQLKDMLPSSERKKVSSSAGRRWCYVLPSLAVARNDFAKWLRTPIDWDEGQ